MGTVGDVKTPRLVFCAGGWGGSSTSSLVRSRFSYVSTCLTSLTFLIDAKQCLPDSFVEARQRADKLVQKGQGIEASEIVACCNAADAAYRLTQLRDPKAKQATWENVKVEARATPFATVVASLSEARYRRI